MTAQTTTRVEHTGTLKVVLRVEVTAPTGLEHGHTGTWTYRVTVTRPNEWSGPRVSARLIGKPHYVADSQALRRRARDVARRITMTRWQAAA